MTAAPNTGYHFVDWTDGVDGRPATDTNVTANMTVTANFAINTYTLTYTAGANGTISGTTPADREPRRGRHARDGGAERRLPLRRLVATAVTTTRARTRT